MDFMKFGYNNYLTLDFIKKYMSEEEFGKKFNFEEICKNPFTYDRKMYVKNHINSELNVLFKKKLCYDAILIISDFMI